MKEPKSDLFSITRRFFLPSLIGLLVVMIASLAISISTIKYLFNTKLDEQHRQTLNIAKNVIAKHTADIGRCLKIITTDKEFQNAFYYATEELIAKKSPLIAMVQSYLALMKLSWIVALDRTGEILFVSDSLSPELLTAVRTMGNSISHIDDSSRHAIAGSRELSSFGEPIGRVAVGFDLDRDFLVELKAITGEDFLLSDDETIFASTVLDTELIALAPSAAGIDTEKRSTIDLHGKSYSFRYLMISSPESSNVLHLGTVADLALLKGGERKIISTTIAVFLLTIILVFILCLLYSRRLAQKFNRLFKDLDEYQQKLINQSKLAAIGQTAAMLAHDIRKPFAMIQTFLNVLPDRRNDERFLAVFMERIDKAKIHVDTLLQDILEFTAEKKPQLEGCNPKKLIVSTLTTVLGNCAAADCSLNYDLQHHGLYHIDIVQTSRVFTNIVTNAIEAMHGVGRIWFATKNIVLAGGGAAAIETTIGNTNSYIEPGDLERIFAPYFTKGKKNGTGLGLAIVEKVIEEHGGSIRVKSAREKGTEFIFTLPQIEGEEDTDDLRLIEHTREVTYKNSDAGLTDLIPNAG